MQVIDLPNIGIVATDVGPAVMEAVGKEISKIQSDFSKATPNNKSLVGNILQEYTLYDCRDTVFEKARELALLHQKTYGQHYNVGMVQNNQSTQTKLAASLKLGGLWVNFMKKGEFNPIHNHTGMYSFVLWYKVPYFANIEDTASPGRRASSNRSGKFEFTFTNILGNISGSVIDVDKTWEGRMILFPALLNHQVYPFYSSDDYRISVAGNLFLDAK